MNLDVDSILQSQHGVCPCACLSNEIANSVSGVRRIKQSSPQLLKTCWSSIYETYQGFVRNLRGYEMYNKAPSREPTDGTYGSSSVRDKTGRCKTGFEACPRPMTKRRRKKHGQLGDVLHYTPSWLRSSVDTALQHDDGETNESPDSLIQAYSTG